MTTAGSTNRRRAYRPVRSIRSRLPSLPRRIRLGRTRMLWQHPLLMGDRAMPSICSLPPRRPPTTFHEKPLHPRRLSLASNLHREGTEGS